MSAAAPQPPIEVRFDRQAVTLDAVQRAAYTLAREASIDVTLADAEIVCTVYPRGPDGAATELTHRLRNAVTDETLRARIAAESEPIRNLIFALAFSRTGLVDDGATGNGEADPPP